MTQEFLPICDVLFNIVSLAAYFCDIVFDLVSLYTFYDEGQMIWFGVGFGFVTFSLISSQVISLKWYYRGPLKTPCKQAIVLIVHFLQCGVLWRYFKLFIPVEVQYVKNDIRDLCVLRLLHAFCEAIPMLLVQTYLMWLKKSPSEITDLNIVSTALSFFSICWGLASYSKNIRRSNIHRFQLTWPGVIFQFFWRFGTVMSRIISLTVYATMYTYWVFLVMGLHWTCMFLWLLSQNVFSNERGKQYHKHFFSILIALVYIFCFINLQEGNSRHRVIAFYTIMLVENTLLIAVWFGQRTSNSWFHYPVLILVWGGFLIGISFMVLYYRFFHIRRLGFVNNYNYTVAKQRCDICGQISCVKHLPHNQLVNIPEHQTINALTFHKIGAKDPANGYLPKDKMIPGVFNCRLNPAFKRKKKKSTSFVPSVPKNGKMDHAFWKRGAKIPEITDSSQKSLVSQGVLCSGVEKKSEVKETKLPDIHQDNSGLFLQCRTVLRSESLPKQVRSKLKLRSQTPEIVLSPHHLETYCSSEMPPQIMSPPIVGLNNIVIRRDFSSSHTRSHHYHLERTSGVKHYPHMSCHSNVPRSHTLPREFKYYMGHRARKTIRSEHFIRSSDSTDGDVDSDDEDSDTGNTKHIHVHQNKCISDFCPSRESKVTNFNETRL